MKQKIYGLLLIVLVLTVACKQENKSSKPNTELESETLKSDDLNSEVRNTKYPERAYFGDQHVHTSWSADAGASGTTVGPEEAVRFALGETVKSNTGQDAKLARPLDWIVVSDHSDGMGIISYIKSGDPELMKVPMIKGWNEGMNSGDPALEIAAKNDIIAKQSNNELPTEITDGKFSKTVWDESTEIMDKYNDPGNFTAFIGYEWTSNYGGGNNLHRNIVYRGNGDEARKMIPENTFISADPESLWNWMQRYEDETGGKILAIPHNGNLSNGLMFSLNRLSGEPITKEYAKARNKWEVLFEITQLKGTSETHPSFFPKDEFANYEIWDKGNLGVQKLKTPEMLKTEYLREALTNGINLEGSLGVNPFKYGIVGGTDTHIGIVSTDEDNYWGKFKNQEPYKERWNELSATSKEDKNITLKGYEYSANGLTAVWATSNTREAIWDGMHRKETYATSGPRISLRFFGSYDFTSADLKANNTIENAYQKGVPMGGDLQKSNGHAPTFMIIALKDVIGVNLDRVQVIKGWVDSKGKNHQIIYNVAWSNSEERIIDKNGDLPPVGNTVDLKTCTVENSIGDSELRTVWTDPDFDANLSAVYYVRVLEIPSPRWTAYDAMRYNIKMDENVPMVVQERAWSSPIWYSPRAGSKTDSK